MLLNSLECTGQPPGQNYLAPTSVAPRLRYPTVLHPFVHQLSTYCVQGCTKTLQGDGVMGLWGCIP